VIPIDDARRRTVADALPFLTLGELLAGGPGRWVFAATDYATGEPVAVKVQAVDPLHDPEARDRIRIEGGIMTRCRHPNLIRGISAHELDDLMIIVMERVDGETVLQHYVGRRLPVGEVCGIVAATAAALQAVHDDGFLHGDVKPENVLFDPAGRHRLIDFGLARHWPFPVEHQVAGTPWYMAPETICSGGALVPATDIYALGMMAYELLAGHLPFPPADGPVGIMRQQLELPPIPLAISASHLPARLTHLVMAAIQKPVEKRPASAGEFAAEVEAIEAQLRERSTQAS
jgi:serine/threonine-protein kinase